MKILKKITALFLLAALLSVMLALPAAASTTVSRDDGLEVTVEMDKEHYEPGEVITARITIKNTGLEAVTIVNLEQLIPEGYKLSEHSQAAAKNFELRPNQTFELEVTYEGDAAAEAEVSAQSFFDRIIYGQTGKIPNLLIAILVILAVVIFMLLT